jgi:HSP20 family protein
MAEKTIPNTKNNETQMVKREITREPDSFVTPLTDIYEEENGLKLVADLPGVDKEGLKLSVDKNILTIEGHVTPDLDAGFLMREYEPSNYFRQFELAESVDQENINAELNNGVLKVFLPFAKETQPKVISVKVH